MLQLGLVGVKLQEPCKPQVLAIRVVEDEGEEARKHSQNSPHVVASLFLLVNLYQSEHLPFLQCQVVFGAKSFAKISS